MDNWDWKDQIEKLRKTDSSNPGLPLLLQLEQIRLLQSVEALLTRLENDFEKYRKVTNSY